MADMLEESAEIARSASDGRIGIVLDTCADVKAVVARPRLCQALRNVLSNALEAYPLERQPIPVRAIARAHAGHIVITVEDHGAGMSQEQMQDARLLFVTTKENGTGFGLPLAIEIVESEHNGRLEIESQLGLGTRVKITLPTEH
jgi:two-component system, sporulation sensor kinase D